MSLCCGHSCPAACETDAAPGQGLDDLQQPWDSQAVRKGLCPVGGDGAWSLWVLSLLVSASWDRILDLLQGKVWTRSAAQTSLML